MSNAVKFVKVTMSLPQTVVTNLDRAVLEARAQGGCFVPRGEVVAAIIESVDLPRFVAKMAKEPR